MMTVEVREDPDFVFDDGYQPDVEVLNAKEWVVKDEIHVENEEICQDDVDDCQSNNEYHAFDSNDHHYSSDGDSDESQCKRSLVYKANY